MTACPRQNTLSEKSNYGSLLPDVGQNSKGFVSTQTESQRKLGWTLLVSSQVKTKSLMNTNLFPRQFLGPRENGCKESFLSPKQAAGTSFGNQRSGMKSSAAAKLSLL